MLNESKLESRHKSLSEKVTKLEKERGYTRDFKHKSRLIDLKKEVNSEIENYKIQIFNGSRDEAENTISEYKIAYNDSSAIIKYEAPNYKIWIGDYYTLIEAEKEILEVRKKYPNAFIFKPTKSINFEDRKLKRNEEN